MQRNSTTRPDRCRVVYVIGELHRGGQERQLYYLLRAMDRAQYQPAVVVWNYQPSDFHAGAIDALGVPVRGLSSTTRLGKLNEFRRIVGDLDAGLVHSYSFHTNFAAAWATAGTRRVAVGSIRSDFEWAKAGSGPLLGRLSARWPSFHIANSASAVAAVASGHGPFAPRHCALVSNGIDIDRFHARPVDMTGPAKILGLGYLRPEKRWDRLLLASSTLHARRDCRHHVTICGGGQLRTRLERLSRRLGIAEHVTLADHTDDVMGPLAESTFMVLTSELEGCPNVVMEAMACGRAVVATDVGDVRRLVDEGRTGFVVPSGDHAALVDRLAVLTRDRECCAAMGAAGRRKAEGEFTLSRIAEQTFRAYREAGWQEPLPPFDASSTAARLAHP